MTGRTVARRVVTPETARIAAVVRELRTARGLSIAQAADATGMEPTHVQLYEAAARGVPSRYAGRLLRLCGVSPGAFVEMLFARADWPAERDAFTPLPEDARLLESALRLWRLEPAAANASLRHLVEAVLAQAPRVEPSARV